jgi:alpha-galactosidase
LRFDRRLRFWAEPVCELSRWLADEAGFKSAFVPESAYDPLYSTWYAFWQDVNAVPLEREAKLAADLGMKTMILDDGWQKMESASFYSATGDWMPVASRFPDMKKHVDAVHRAGLKYMLWLAVPYMGDEAKAWERFKDKLLEVQGRKSPGRVGVLDPRFPEVREYLISTYERAVGEWGFDGLKLDFIDCFKLPAVDPAVKDNYAGRDIRSVPEAVDRLMKDILARLKKINPDVLVEFRQSYMGSAILQYGNMIRAADCPADPWANRKRICDLRLTSGSTSVHSDMIAWSGDESAAGAALPILNALFATIQYSMILEKASAEHREVIRHWLRFSQEHRETLLKSAFRPRHPQNAYPLIEAESDRELIVAVYNPDTVAAAKAGKKSYVINATLSPSLVVELDGAVRAELYDTLGRKVTDRDCGKGLVRLDVPAGGFAKFTSR